ncbi:MAG: hypothetical protein M1338_03200 [Patescibacteria group bacterium]|nr:hypothetical protein [Patescibacteria group bacterium]
MFNKKRAMFVLSFLTLLLFSTGCGTILINGSTDGNGGIADNPWGLAVPNKTGIDPVCGFYNMHDVIGFSVIRDPDTGEKYISFARDGYRFDRIAIDNGGFINWWGNTNGQGHCPTDAYGLTGCFVNDRTAQGVYKRGNLGRITDEQNFSADLVQEYIYELGWLSAILPWNAY